MSHVQKALEGSRQKREKGRSRKEGSKGQRRVDACRPANEDSEKTFEEHSKASRAYAGCRRFATQGKRVEGARDAKGLEGSRCEEQGK